MAIFTADEPMSITAIVGLPRLIPDRTRLKDSISKDDAVRHWRRPRGALETSRSAGASKTTQMASPRRNTAAPLGLAQGKLNSTWPLASLASIWTTPPAGI